MRARYPGEKDSDFKHGMMTQRHDIKTLERCKKQSLESFKSNT
jgi:hypothetical protein